jgi:hypothetical protein
MLILFYKTASIQQNAEGRCHHYAVAKNDNSIG